MVDDWIVDFNECNLQFNNIKICSMNLQDTFPRNGIITSLIKTFHFEMACQGGRLFDKGWFNLI